MNWMNQYYDCVFIYENLSGWYNSRFGRETAKAISPIPGPLLPSGDKGDVVQDLKSLSGERRSVGLHPS